MAESRRQPTRLIIDLESLTRAPPGHFRIWFRERASRCRCSGRHRGPDTDRRRRQALAWRSPSANMAVEVRRGNPRSPHFREKSPEKNFVGRDVLYRGYLRLSKFCCFSERTNASTMDFIICQASTGGIALPNALYCTDSEPASMKVSGKD